MARLDGLSDNYFGGSACFSIRILAACSFRYLISNPIPGCHTKFDCSRRLVSVSSKHLRTLLSRFFIARSFHPVLILNNSRKGLFKSPQCVGIGRKHLRDFLTVKGKVKEIAFYMTLPMTIFNGVFRPSKGAVYATL